MNILENIITADLSSAIFWALFHSLWISLLVCGVLYFVLKSAGNWNSVYRYNFAAIGYVLIVFLTLVMFIREYIRFDTISSSGLAQFLTNYSAFFVQVWLIGLILLSIKYLMGFNSNKILRNNSHPLALEYLKTAKELAIKLGIRHPFKFRESDIAVSPITIGWLKPLVLLPVGIASSLPYSQIEILIAHELAHLKRNDYFFKHIQAMFDIVFYFNPFTHWLSNVIQLEREKTCKEIAAKLTSEDTPAAAPQESEPSLSFSREGKKILKSVKHLVGNSDESENPNRNGAIIILTIVLCSMVLLAFTNSGSSPLSISGLQNGNSMIDMLQLDSNIDQITKMLNNIENPQMNSGTVNKGNDKTGAVPGISDNGMSERYAESLQSMGIDIDDLNGNVDVYNKFLENNLLGPGMSMPGMEKLDNLEGFDGEFDMQKFQKDMSKMNEQLKSLREIVKGQPQVPVKE